MGNKILFTASSYEHIRHFHLPYLRIFSDMGWRVHVGCAGVPDNIPYAEKTFCLPFRKSLCSVSNFYSAYLLRNIIEDERYSLISTHTSLAAFFTRLSLQGKSKGRPKLVNTVHGYLFDENTHFLKRNLLLYAEKMMAENTDLIMVMNHADESIARENALCSRIARIPGMGVLFSRFDDAEFGEKEAARQKLSIPVNAFVMIYPAEFSKRKNQEFLIRAMPRLPDNVILILPGSGVYRDKCYQLAENLRLLNRVRFPGHVRDVGAWFTAADVSVSASRIEGLPFHVIEAMHMGLPVIASDVKGNQDLIQHETNGLLYPFGNESRFTDSVLRLMSDSTLRQNLSKRAKNDAECYGLNHVLPIVMRKYEHLMGEGCFKLASND